MAIKKTQRGFALLIAIIFMSVMLSFGLALGSIGYKQQVLASNAIESQYAFYAADAALECALYADQQQNLFAFPPSQPPSAPSMTCDGSAPLSAAILSYTVGTQWVVTNRLSLDAEKRCADVTIYKPAPGIGTTYLFSQGYDVSCSTVSGSNGARFVSRGLSASYTSSAPPSPPTEQQAYTTPGSYQWIAPEGVTSVSIVCVGAGGGASQGWFAPGFGTYYGGGGGGALAYINGLPVTPGNAYTVVVGASSASGAGGDSSFSGGGCNAGGGQSNQSSPSSGVGGTVISGYGFAGGSGGGAPDIMSGAGPAGGGGAGGYAGGGGAGGNSQVNGPGYGGSAAAANSGGGGGGGSGGPNGVPSGQAGGGVGIFGIGNTGVASAANVQGDPGSGGSGSTYGGGGNTFHTAGGGAVRIIWPGTTRSFPSTNTID